MGGRRVKINAQITLLVGGNDAGTTKLEIRDRDAGICFVALELTAEKFVGLLARQGLVRCDAEVQGLENVGKMQVHKKHEFRIGPSDYHTRDDIARAEARASCPPGWTTDGYFGSQSSFFRRDGEEWARTTIRRWVDIEEQDR